MIRLSRVSKFYKTENHRKVVLDDVTYSFDTRYTYGILGGSNGAGKSTLLRLIGGTELPNSGQIFRDLRISWPLGSGGGFHPPMTGRDNIKFVSRLYGASARARDPLLEIFPNFKIISTCRSAPIRPAWGPVSPSASPWLSISIATSSTKSPPSATEIRLAVQTGVREKRGRSSMIMVSHSIGTMKAYCDRGLVLHRGKLVAFGHIDDAIEFYRKNL